MAHPYNRNRRHPKPPQRAQASALLTALGQFVQRGMAAQAAVDAVLANATASPEQVSAAQQGGDAEAGAGKP